MSAHQRTLDKTMAMMLEGLLSWEILFWLPTLLDVLLLLVTYSSCKYHGVNWYLNTQAEVIAAQKKKNDDTPSSVAKPADASGSTAAFDLSPEVHAVWELAMAAYSAYACLLPLAVYWCVVSPEFRPQFCCAMTVLMVGKIFILSKSSSEQTITDSKRKEGLKSLFYFYLPTYGGYAVLKTFVL